ncbi:MAG: methylated-DNA--[protein]-cysteine S-methyltransferase [Bacillota bacterium]
MRNVYFSKTQTPLGEIYLASSDSGLCKLKLQEENTMDFFRWMEKHFDEAIEDDDRNAYIVNQLDLYFQKKLKYFEVELDLIGTAFQQKVWRALADIPYGQVYSYKNIAEKVGCLKGYRAIGMANNKNNIPIIVPCHRVVGSDGKLVGYGGGLHIKTRLLTLEGIAINEGKVVTG